MISHQHLDNAPLGRCESHLGMVGVENALGGQVDREMWRFVELTGFEPVAPSLRKMWSKPSDQGKRAQFWVLWHGCGASDGRRGETLTVCASRRTTFLNAGFPSPAGPAPLCHRVSARRRMKPRRRCSRSPAGSTPGRLAARSRPHRSPGPGCCAADLGVPVERPSARC